MSEVRKPLGNGRELVIETTDDQILTAVEKIRGQLTDDVTQFPKLTAAHLMGGPKDIETNTGVANYIDQLLTRQARAMFVGAGLFKRLRDASANLLWDTHYLGPRGFVMLVRATMRADSLAAGLTDKELEYSWEIFDHNVKILAAAGAAFRKRKDWRG